MRPFDLTHRHALKLEALSKAQQARVLKKLERQSRAYHKEHPTNAPTNDADVYAWHRRVRVSREARAIHLVRCFLKNTPYHKVENKITKHTINPIIVFEDYFSIQRLSDDIRDAFHAWANAEAVVLP